MGVGVLPAYGWKGIVAAFYPVTPPLVLLDAGLFAASDRAVAQVESLCAEVPLLPIVIVGDIFQIPASMLLALGSIGARDALRVEDLSIRRIRSLSSWTVGSRVLLRWGADRARPVPAVLSEAVGYAMARHTARLSVERLATHVGYSSRGLRAALARIGAPQPRALISWGRVLWAVRDLSAEPRRSGDCVARDLGFSSSSIMGNAMHRHLGVRIGVARERGLDWAITRLLEQTNP